jgi:hypothetical protein
MRVLPAGARGIEERGLCEQLTAPETRLRSRIALRPGNFFERPARVNGSRAGAFWRFHGIGASSAQSTLQTPGALVAFNAARKPGA